ncbi:hypothetical protein ISF_00545 [Cordyceps fumosorosea ARSEF 2679]|uniref:Succinyl-3-ketoacid-coenzyme a transferase n=1 Tax=Cordyceps fumosorosea (strain ARSEF 2679) TaxID=1081104 RepID=A0A162LP83_CORFA|nr:hypothetical protein ISF_00545 [Cordyceps fumosorosea ARSEF 2679]OAA73644.1 hypothetical protein ISF_00545 [Cordyceps fumosorosea ARSEF 2679]
MYDRLSGMSVTEWTVAARLPSTRGSLDWSRVAPLKYQEPPGKRARPLVDMAIRVVARNIGHASREMLEQPIPPRLLWRLWRFLEARGGACLHAWRIFSDILMSDDDDGSEDPVLGLHRFRQHVCRPEEELALYTGPLDSPSVEFVAHLVISGDCLFTGNELLALAGMRNLGVLELIRPADDLPAAFPHVSDRLIRGWSEAADPFPLLRVLRIWGDRSVTQGSLRWAARFPSLVLYDVVAGKDDWAAARTEAEATGWTLARQAPRAEDASILRSLLLLAPPAATSHQMPSGGTASRNIDVDLINVSSDPRCVLRRVPPGEAPPLLDYLADPAKLTTNSLQPETSLRRTAAAAAPPRQFCHETAFEAWAFWLYALVGQLSGDRDLAGRGVALAWQTVAGPFVLPSKPMASVFLGHSGPGGITSKPAYVGRGLFATKRFTFTRLDILDGVMPPNTRVPEARVVNPVHRSERQQPSLKNSKRRRMEDLLDSFP